MKIFDVSRFTKSGLSRPWTSCSDIGREYKGDVFTIGEYLEVEARYIRAIDRFISAVGAGGRLRAHKVESWETDSTQLSELGLSDVFDGQPQPHEGEQIAAGRVRNIVRRCLREVAWLELVSEPDLVIHFGYDCHVFIGIDGDPSLIDGVVKQIVSEDALCIRKSSVGLRTVDEWLGVS